MKAEKIIELLKAGKVEKLFEEATEEFKLEDVKRSSDKLIMKKVYNYIQKRSEFKPVLKKCIYTDDGSQVFTDAYIMFILKSNEKNMLFEEAKKEENYPDLMRYTSIYANTNTNTIIDSEQHLKAIKLSDNIEYNIVDNTYVDKKLLELALLTLKDKKIKLYYRENEALKPIYLENENGSIVIIVPLKKID